MSVSWYVASASTPTLMSSARRKANNFALQSIARRSRRSRTQCGFSVQIRSTIDLGHASPAGNRFSSEPRGSGPSSLREKEVLVCGLISQCVDANDTRPQRRESRGGLRSVVRHVRTRAPSIGTHVQFNRIRWIRDEVEPRIHTQRRCCVPEVLSFPILWLGESDTVQDILRQCVEYFRNGL
jgi:hypothetical protein